MEPCHSRDIMRQRVLEQRSHAAGEAGPVAPVAAFLASKQAPTELHLSIMYSTLRCRFSERFTRSLQNTS